MLSKYALKAANAWGLHDMHGNVSEWCEDTWHDSYDGAPMDGKAWTGDAATPHVLRGGFWASDAGECRSASREKYAVYYFGFRVAARQFQAHAGADQVVHDADGDGQAEITLDATGSSSSGGSITGYAWSQDGLNIATGPNPTVTLPVGTHKITLTVTLTDESGAASSDSVKVEVKVTRFPLITLDLGKGVTLELVEIPGGSFVMGSPESDQNAPATERPQRFVTMSAFAIGETEVTHAQWRAVMGMNLCDPTVSCKDRPVETVSWEDCREFCGKLSELSGRAIRLPTEAEWEYACRAGSTTRYSFGDSNLGLDDHAWCWPTSDGEMHPVGHKTPNAWGLYDMHGNVSEWCEDLWHDSYEGAPTDGSAWTAGGEGGNRVVRGGVGPAGVCRSATRVKESMVARWKGLGLRVVND